MERERKGTEVTEGAEEGYSRFDHVSSGGEGGGHIFPDPTGNDLHAPKSELADFGINVADTWVGCLEGREDPAYMTYAVNLPWPRTKTSGTSLILRHDMSYNYLDKGISMYYSRVALCVNIE